MRAVFGLFTAFPIDSDPADIGAGWLATVLVGLVLGGAWFMVHQIFVRVGGPFVAAGAVLLLHVALTGGRSLRGVAGVSAAITREPDEEGTDGLPGVEGAATAVVVLLLLIASSFLIRVDVAPAVLLMVPLIGKGVQALLLGEDDTGVGVQPPGPGQKVGIAVTTIVGLAAAPALVLLVRPVRLDAPIEGVGYLVLGILALAVTLLVGLLARAWLHARFGSLDADGWHALGAVTELTALAVVATRIS
ncbi:hypothetical protein BH23ACT9_BH23ACT9_08680 [soil metagenome]